MSKKKKININNYSLFNEINNPALRAWNRMEMALSISEDLSDGMAEAYLNRLDENEQMQVFVLASAIKARGDKESVKRDVLKSAGIMEAA